MELSGAERLSRSRMPLQVLLVHGMARTPPNDGTVAVSETRCLAVDAVSGVPVHHTFMMNDRRVRRVIQDVLNRVAAQPVHLP
jgi:hypothetical protein